MYFTGEIYPNTKSVFCRKQSFKSFPGHPKYDKKTDEFIKIFNHLNSAIFVLTKECDLFNSVPITMLWIWCIRARFHLIFQLQFVLPSIGEIMKCHVHKWEFRRTSFWNQVCDTTTTWFKYCFLFVFLCMLTENKFREQYIMKYRNVFLYGSKGIFKAAFIYEFPHHNLRYLKS